MRTFTTAVLSATALLLLSACGGGDDAATASAASSSAGAASPSAAPAEDDGAFCDDAQAALSSIESAFTSVQADPTQASAAFGQAADELGTVTPPAEIEADWQTLVDSFRQVADGTEGLDISTPEGESQFQAVVDGLSGEADTASTNVETYLTDSCGITAGTPSATS